MPDILLVRRKRALQVLPWVPARSYRPGGVDGVGHARSAALVVSLAAEGNREEAADARDLAIQAAPAPGRRACRVCGTRRRVGEGASRGRRGAAGRAAALLSALRLSHPRDLRPVAADAAPLGCTSHSLLPPARGAPARLPELRGRLRGAAVCEG